MADCLFCKMVRKEIPTEILYEDNQVIVIKDIRPKARIHLLIIAKQHIPSLVMATEKDAVLLSDMLLLLPKLAEVQDLKEGFRTVINTGAGGGQEIDHIHFHLLGGGNLPRM